MSADSGNSGRGGNSKGSSAKSRRSSYSSRKSKDGDKFVFSDLSKIGDLDDYLPFS